MRSILNPFTNSIEKFYSDLKIDYFEIFNLEKCPISIFQDFHTSNF